MKKGLIEKIFVLSLIFMLILPHFSFISANEENSDSLSIVQGVEKYIDLGENQVLLQQNLNVKLNNEESSKKAEKIEITAPVLQGNKPELKGILINGKRLEENYTYNVNTGIITIELNDANSLGETETNYKVIYKYSNINIEQASEITLGLNVTTTTNENIELTKQEEKDTSLELIGENIEIQAKITEETYKGYLYQGITGTDYQEEISMDISYVDNLENITIENQKEVYITETQEIDTIQATYYKTTTVNKNNIIDILGTSGQLTIKNGDKVLAEITNNTTADENGNIIINYNENEINKLNIITTKPQKIGSLKITHLKTINPIVGYTKTQLKELKILKETIAINEKTIDLQMNLLDTYTEAKMEVNKTSWSTVIENKEVEFSVILKSDSNKYDLYKNPTIRLELPSDIEEINVNSVNKLYGDEFENGNSYVSTQDGRKYINIELKGEQTEYKEESLEGTRIVINANIILNKTATSKTDKIVLEVTNEAGTNYSKEQEISIISPKELITIHNIPELGIETIGEENEISYTVEKGAEEKTINIESQVINNNEGDIKDISILGNFGTNQEKNNMGINLVSGINVEAIDNSKISIYYTENAEANEDLQDENNGWNEQILDNSKVCKYLIKVTSMTKSESIKLKYQINIPANLEYNKNAYQGYKVTYTNETTGEAGSVNSTIINLETGKGPEIEAILTAKVGNKILEPNKEVKQGEVIRYQLEVKNTGTEDATNIIVKGNIPEGTVAVEPIAEYQYKYGEYYQEITKENYEFTIAELKVGETKSFTYEVRVKSDTVAGNKITGNGSIEYDGIKHSSELSNIVKNANLRVSIKSKIDNNFINEGEIIGYQAIIENISNKEQKNITLNWDFPEVYEINSHYRTNEDGNFEIGDYKQKSINIDSILPNEKVVIDINLIVNKQEGIENNSITATVTQGGEKYYSNELLEYIDTLTNVSITLESTNAENYVKPGDMITYKIIATNNNTKSTQISIYDLVPIELTVRNVTLNGEEQLLNEEVNQILLQAINLEVGEQVVIEIKAIVNNRENAEKDEISNQATVLVANKEIESNRVSHIIEYQKTENPEGPENPNNLYSIRGKAWLDENQDGELQENETSVNGTKVYAMNVTTGEITKETTTGEAGIYALDNLPQGKYIVVFDYDYSKYRLTTYEKEGINESRKSKVISKKIQINNLEKNYAVTDTIELVDKSIGNINMGLVKLEKFDLKLDKTISKVIVQSSQGTNVYSYQDASLAKVELHSKTINNSNVIVEYKIKVTNQGEIDGYVKKIVDYIPEGFKFSSELNKDWYQSGGNLYNATLANEKILPGESKVVTLSLIKTMTAETTGTYTNTAEIAEDYNDAGILDINSVPNNMKKEENDINSAELIITVSTGAIAMYSIIIILSIMIIATGIYFIKTKVLNNNL